MSHPHRFLHQVGPILGGVLIAVLIVLGYIGVEVRSSPPAGSVTLDGIEVNLTYEPGSAHIFGKTEQNTCHDCPLILSGGENDSALELFWFQVPTNYTAIVTMSISSAVPFQAVYGWCFAPGPCNVTTNFSTVGDPWTLGEDQGRPWLVDLLVPNPAPNLPNGFWIYFNATVNATFR